MKYLLVFFMVGLMLASITTHAGGPGRGFSSSRSSFGGGSRSSSFGGFRSSSSPSYRSFSSSPSRTFTYRPSAPSASAPRYSAPAATSRSTYRSKTTVNNHYHGGTNAGSSSGLGLMDYVILDNMMSRDRGPAYVSQAPVVHQQPIAYSDGVASAVVYREESHFWRNVILTLVVSGIIYGVYRLVRPA